MTQGTKFECYFFFVGDHMNSTLGKPRWSQSILSEFRDWLLWRDYSFGPQSKKNVCREFVVYWLTQIYSKFSFSFISVRHWKKSLLILREHRKEITQEVWILLTVLWWWQACDWDACFLTLKCSPKLMSPTQIKHFRHLWHFHQPRLHHRGNCQCQDWDSLTISCCANINKKMPAEVLSSQDSDFLSCPCLFWGKPSLISHFKASEASEADPEQRPQMEMYLN